MELHYGSMCGRTRSWTDAGTEINEIETVPTGTKIVRQGPAELESDCLGGLQVSDDENDLDGGCVRGCPGGPFHVGRGPKWGGCLDAVCLELDGYRTTTWQAVAPQRGRSLEVVPTGPIQTSDWALSINGALVHPSPGNGRLQFDNLPRPADSLDGEPWPDAVRWSAYGRTYMYLVYKGRHRLALPSISDVLVRPSTSSRSRGSTSQGSRSTTTSSGGGSQSQQDSGNSDDWWDYGDDPTCHPTNRAKGWC